MLAARLHTNPLKPEIVGKLPSLTAGGWNSTPSVSRTPARRTLGIHGMVPEGNAADQYEEKPFSEYNGGVWYAPILRTWLEHELVEPRLSAMLLVGFGAVAVILPAVGLYGIMASAVPEQTREIAVRIALGATAAGIRRRVPASGLDRKRAEQPPSA